MQYLGFPTESETLLQSIHYISLPFLLAALCSMKGRERRMAQRDKLLLIYTVLIVIFSRLFLERSGGISIWINILLEPILLFQILNTFNSKDLRILQKIIVCFLFVESGVAMFEAVTNSIVFADLTQEMAKELSQNMRAYSLHGHPLQNCFVVCVISTIIIASNLNLLKRYIFFFVGFLGMMAFNSRSAVVLLVGIFAISVLHDFSTNRISNLQKIFIFITGVIGICAIFHTVSTYELGTRLDTGFSTDDGSSMARFMLINIVLDMSFTDLLLGNNLTQQILNKYTMMATIENSFLNLVFNNGLILTIPYILFMYHKIKSVQMNKYMFRVIIIMTFLLLNINNIIITLCPSISILLITLYAFKDNPNDQTKDRIIV